MKASTHRRLLFLAMAVVLAPMAGVTNAAFRQLCREQGAGLYVCEMITSRGIVERDAKTLSMLFSVPRDLANVEALAVSANEQLAHNVGMRIKLQHENCHANEGLVKRDMLPRLAIVPPQSFS